jgi:hypothetical protein
MLGGIGAVAAHIWCGEGAGDVTADTGCGTQKGPCGHIPIPGRGLNCSGSACGTQGPVWCVTGAPVAAGAVVDAGGAVDGGEAVTAAVVVCGAGAVPATVGAEVGEGSAPRQPKAAVSPSAAR